MKIFINEIINASNAISHNDGLTVFDYIKSYNKDSFILSFDGINRVSTAFLNACIGKMILEGTFRNEYIDRDNTKSMILMKIDTVKENASNYTDYEKIVSEATAQC